MNVSHTYAKSDASRTEGEEWTFRVAATAAVSSAFHTHTHTTHYLPALRGGEREEEK